MGGERHESHGPLPNTLCSKTLNSNLKKNLTRSFWNGLSKSILGGGGDFLILESQYSAPRAFAANQTFAKFAFSPNFFFYIFKLTETKSSVLIFGSCHLLLCNCQLNQLFSNSEAAMLSYPLWRSRVHWPFEQRNKTRPLIFFPVAIQHQTRPIT